MLEIKKKPNNIIVLFFVNIKIEYNNTADL